MARRRCRTNLCNKAALYQEYTWLVKCFVFEARTQIFNSMPRLPRVQQRIGAVESSPMSGMMRPIGGDRDFRPFRRLVSSGGIAKHITVTLVILSHDDDAGLSASSPEVAAGSIATTILARVGLRFGGWHR